MLTDIEYNDKAFHSCQDISCDFAASIIKKQLEMAANDKPNLSELQSEDVTTNQHAGRSR